MSNSSSESSDSEIERIEQIPVRHIRVQLRQPILIMPNENQIPIVQQNLNYPPGFHMSILNEIPQYNGNPVELSEYVRAVEDIFNQFYQFNDPNAYINKLLLSAARNRIKGPALEVVTGQTILSWNDLKTILIDNFGDQRSELNLIIDLSRLRQNPREHPVDFYNRCRSLMAILNSKISLSNDAQDIKLYRINNAKALALKAFVSGLAEPLGSFLRSRAPPTLENSLVILKEELDVRYFQNNQTKSQNLPQYPTKLPQQNKAMLFTKQNPQSSYLSTQQNYFPRTQPFNSNFTPMSQINPYKPPTQFQNYQGPLHKQEQNAFAPNKNFKPSFRPEPMQTSTIQKRPASQQIGNSRQRAFTQQNSFQKRNNGPTNYFTNNGQSSNFMSEELYNFNAEQDPNRTYPLYAPDDNNLQHLEYSDNTDDFNEDEYYPDFNEDFRLQASEYVTT